MVPQSNIFNSFTSKAKRGISFPYHHLFLKNTPNICNIFRDVAFVKTESNFIQIGGVSCPIKDNSVRRMWYLSKFSFSPVVLMQ